MGAKTNRRAQLERGNRHPYGSWQNVSGRGGWACRPVDSHTWADLSGTGRAAWLAAISSASHKRENLKARGQ